MKKNLLRRTTLEMPVLALDLKKDLFPRPVVPWCPRAVSSGYNQFSYRASGMYTPEPGGASGTTQDSMEKS